MNFGGGFAQQQPQMQQQSGLNMSMAEQELEMVTTLFNNIVDSCYKKCVPPKYHDNELNKGESVCIDRCVAKYFEVNMKVGQKLTAQANQGQAMQ
ncbi:protein transporter tim10 [Thoreauomyces humboldtii]|nr:protein transporter tim10 [Thoreauomyces humboldtii]